MVQGGRGQRSMSLALVIFVTERILSSELSSDSMVYVEEPQPMTASGQLRGLLRLRGLQLLALAALLAFVGWRAMQMKFSVLDLDIWWHIKVGEWIVAHRGFPHVGILSRTAADRPWSAYSWGYELMLSRGYDWFGLVGVGMFGTLLTLTVAYAVYWMARRLSGNFWLACLLSTVSCSAFLFNLMPRPVFLSMTLYAVTLTVLLEAQRTGRVQLLYWLPLVFLLWANCHIQFVYGIFTIGLFTGVHLLLQVAARWTMVGEWVGEWVRTSILPARLLALIFAACLLATCIGPYSYHLYFVVFAYASSTFPYTFIREFQALNFRAASHYVELVFAAIAFFTLGREKRIDLFKLGLMIVASVVAFRTMRDSWFLCIAAAACMADTLGGKTLDRKCGENLFEKMGLAAALALLLIVFARNTDFNTQGLDDAMSSVFPVNAVNFLRRNPQPGPLYNTFDWGGFLTWYMPDQPVAIDGRTDLYGDEIDTRFFKTQQGDASYVDDPYLNEARVLLLPKKVPLASVLLTDSRFSLIFQDRLAVIFVRH